MILVPFVPFILVLGIGYTYFTDALRDTTIARMHRIVEDHKHMIETFLAERKKDLEFIADSYSYDMLSESKKTQETFASLQKASNAFIDLGIFNGSGMHVAYYGPYELAGKTYTDAGWFKEVLKNGYYISDVFLGFRGVPHFIVAVLKADENQKWVLRATIDSDVFNRLVKKVRIGKTGECYLLNAEGIYQTERRSGGEPMQKDPDYPLYAEYHKDIRAFVDNDTLGETYLYATSWMKDNHWLLVVRQEQADAFKSLRSATYLIALISACGGAAIVILAFYLTNYIVRRMEQTDIEKNRLETQLFQAGRFAEIGEMAAGFAHEINNPLQIMKSEKALIAALLSDMKEEGRLTQSEELAELTDSLEQVDMQIDRCAEITQAILKFSRQSEPAFGAIDLRSFIPEVTNMVAKRASVAGILISQDVSDDMPPVYGDPVQLQQVLLNLLNNALDATAEQDAGTAGQLRITGRPGKGENVEIGVGDNGCGIDPDNLEKIFTPFFTTKPVGKGTGLGLSVCYGIIDSMGGTMTVSSEKGVGSTFTISLPIADRQSIRGYNQEDQIWKR